MGAHRKPIEESLRWEIYLEYKHWCETWNTVCTPHAFRVRVLPGRGYKMCNGTFQREWDRLITEGLIKIEPITGAPIVVDLNFLDKALVAELKKLEERLLTQISA